MSDAGIGTGSTGAPRDVLVLGGTGWIGRLVAERLAA
ncbi:NAD(P)-dependent oxidoreductase, partial [Clavibacter michiganensis]